MIHQFGPVSIDRERRELRFDGEVRHLEPQVFDLLVYLIEHRNRVVPKQELFDQVWGSKFISASALTSQIGSARKAVGDDGRNQAVIRTAHGRGYQFVAALDTPRAATKHAPASGWDLVGREAELEQLHLIVDSGDSAGVLLTGPPGIGKSTVARLLTQRFEAQGRSVAHVYGHTQVRELPLACLAHLLPADVLGIADLDGDMAKSLLVLRARESLRQMANGRPMLILIDDVDQVDALSLTVFGSLIEDNSIFAVMTQRTEPETKPAFDHLLRAGSVMRMNLAPLSTLDSERLVLSTFTGPVSPRLPSVLVAVADGNPGLLQLLVDGVLTSGAAYQHGGIWLLDEPIAASIDMASLMDDRLRGLSAEHRHAVELLAVAGELEINLGIELLGDGVVDDLERAGLLSLETDAEHATLRLVHPMLGEVLRQALSPLRARRLKEKLVEVLEMRSDLQPSDRSRVVRLRLDIGGAIEPNLAVEAATLSLIDGDIATTEKLLTLLDGYTPASRVIQLEAELLFAKGQFRDAGAALAKVDLDELDDLSGAFAVRRRATALFYGDWDQAAAAKLLTSNFDRFEDEARATLQSYWMLLAAVDGRHAPETVELGNRLLATTTDFVRLEVLAGIGMAYFVLGRLDEALAAITEFKKENALLPPSLTWAGPDYAQFVEINVLTELGDLHAATKAIEKAVAKTGLSSMGYLPISAARILWRSGRNDEALNWLDPLVELADLIGLATNSHPMRCTTARAALDCGDKDRARREIAVLETALNGTATFAQLDMIETIGRVEMATGDLQQARRRLAAGAALAESSGVAIMEASLLSALVEAGGAAEATDRLEALTHIIDGPLIRLKLDHAQAFLAGEPSLEAVAQRYEDRGFVREAATARAQII